jgi:glycosyltransferase involved in cell wall biosynthesis
MRHGLDIVIPVYNEGENILRTLEEIERCIEIPHRVLVVYDFDEDNTIPVVRGYLPPAGSEVVLLKNTLGRGVLNALKTGFQKAEAEAVLVVMGDLSDDLSAVPRMYGLIGEGYDLVCGSRYMKGGRQIGGPVLKGLLSRAAGLSLYYLTGIPTRDTTNNFKLYGRRLLDAVEIESTGGFEVAMEIAVKAHLMGFRITEVPATWRERTAGESRFRMASWMPRYLKWYFHLLLRRGRRTRSGGHGPQRKSD